MKQKGMILGVLVLLASIVFLIASWLWVTVEPRLDARTMPTQAAASTPPAHADAVEEGRKLARSFVAGENLSGLSVAVAIDGEIVWAEGFGWADYTTHDPVTPSTRYRIGRVTETITAAAAGLLHDRGRLDLDAPVQRYLPDFPEKRWPISTRQLLSHAAGIRDQRGERESLRRSSCADDRERLALFAGDPLLFQPGTHDRYSAYGYVLAGAVIAAAAGEPWSDFVRREIFVPLDMRDTVVDFAGVDDPRHAHGYFPRMACDSRSGLEEAPRVDLSCIRPAAGLVSTPTDLVRLGSAMIEGRIPSSETTASIPVTPRREPEESAVGWLVRRALMGRDETSPRAVCRADSVPGGSASLVTVQDRGLAIAVTTNVSFADVASLSSRLVDIFARSAAPVRDPAGDSGRR